MPVSIQMPTVQKQDTPLDKLASALSVAKAVYGIYADHSTLEMAKQKYADQENSPEKKLGDLQASQGLQSATDLQDPESQPSKLAKSALLANISALKDSGAIKNKTIFNDLVSQVPSMTGAQAQQYNDSPMLKSIRETGKTDAVLAAALARAGATKSLADYRGQSIDERKNQNSVQAGHAWESDPIIKTAKTNLNSLQRSMSILDNPDKPLQVNDLNLAYTDYINAVAAGGSATEGKIHRELPDTFEQSWEALKQKAGGKGDLRQTPEGQQLIGLLKQNIGKVQGDLIDATADQNENLKENYGANTNPKVQQVVGSKYNSYTAAALTKKYGKAAATAPTAAAPLAKQVIQGGHTYILNEQTGQYE